MKIDKTISADHEAVIAVEIPAEVAGKACSETMEAFRRKANLPGFRPGKVPMSLIRQRFGKELLTEKAEEIAREKLSEVLKEAELAPGGPIDIRLLEYGEDKPLRFEVLFPLKPVVELAKYHNLKVVINEAEVTEADIDAEIESQRRRFQELKEIDEPAPIDAKIKLKIQEVDPSGLPLIGREIKELDFQFGLDKLGAGTDEQLLGVKAGEIRIIHSQIQGLESSAPPTRIISPGDARNDYPRNAETYYSVEVVSVKASILPEINDEFASKVEEGLKNLEDLRKWLRIQLTAMVSYSMRQQLHKGLVSRLIEENPFVVSKSIIDNLLRQAAEDDQVPEDKIDAYITNSRAELEREFRWAMLSEKIGEVEGLSVTAEELDAEIAQIAEQIKRPMEEIMEYYRQNEGLDRLKKRLFERKMLEFLATNAEVDKRAMTLSEFAKDSEAVY